MSHVIRVNGKTLTEQGISIKDGMRLADTHCKVRFGQRVEWDMDLEDAKELNCNSGDVTLVDQVLNVEVFSNE